MEFLRASASSHLVSSSLQTANEVAKRRICRALSPSSGALLLLARLSIQPDALHQPQTSVWIFLSLFSILLHLRTPFGEKDQCRYGSKEIALVRKLVFGK